MNLSSTRICSAKFIIASVVYTIPVTSATTYGVPETYHDAREVKQRYAFAYLFDETNFSTANDRRLTDYLHHKQQHCNFMFLTCLAAYIYRNLSSLWQVINRLQRDLFHVWEMSSLCTYSVPSSIKHEMDITMCALYPTCIDANKAVLLFYSIAHVIGNYFLY